jgi:2-iminobutanoate/2-iminopropanoate deaminase
MARIEVKTEHAPAPVAPYSQAIQIGNIVAVAGQAGVDPDTGTITSASVAGQTVQTFKNIEAILSSIDFSLSDVIRVDVYLSDMSDFAAMNVEYAKVFIAPYPARTTIGVRLATGLKVEITVLAIKE